MRSLRRVWIILALILAAIIVPFLLWGDFFESLLNVDATRILLERNRPIAWLIGIALLIADLALPIPSTIVMSALGWLYGPLLGGLAASLGSFLSALVAYGLSRKIGRPLALRLADASSLDAASAWFTTKGGAVIALSRCLPVLNEAVACLAGLSKFPPREFILASLMGALPVGFVFACIGHLGHDHSGTATLLSAAIPVLLWLAHRWISRKSSA